MVCSMNRRPLPASRRAARPRSIGEPRTYVVSARGTKPLWGNPFLLYVQLVGIRPRRGEIPQRWDDPVAPWGNLSSGFDEPQPLSASQDRTAHLSRTVVDGASPVRRHRWSRDRGQLQVIPRTVMGGRGQASKHAMMVADSVTLDPECCAEESTQARQVLIAGGLVRASAVRALRCHRGHQGELKRQRGDGRRRRRRPFSAHCVDHQNRQQHRPGNADGCGLH